MISLFTQLLKDYLVRQNVAPDPATGVTPPARIVLGPPDRTFATGLQQGQTVNIYLADLRENRRLRTNERQRQAPTATRANYLETLEPAWVDAHYLITAWDTAADKSRQALAEQKALANMSSALLAGDPFTPVSVYDTDATLPQLEEWDEEFRRPGLPYQVLPPEGFPKLSEFWTTMGTGSVWKPVVYLVAAVPVKLKPQFDFPVVTTMRTSTGQTVDAPRQRLIYALDEEHRLRGEGTDRTWFQIGGFVRNLFGPQLTPVTGAKVTLQLAGDAAVAPPVPAVPLQETRTDDGGRYQFQFAGPMPGQVSRLQVSVQKIGLQAAPVDVVLTPAEPFPHDVVMRPV